MPYTLAKQLYRNVASFLASSPLSPITRATYAACAAANPDIVALARKNAGADTVPQRQRRVVGDEAGKVGEAAEGCGSCPGSEDPPGRRCLMRDCGG